MKPIFIGIAGGTGAGKSTLCTSLQDKYPEQIGLIQLDDYFKPTKDIPMLDGLRNWDHPDALYFDKLVEDLSKLASGQSVVINTKNERLNPDYKTTDKRIPVEFKPKPIMLVEGYLVLFDKRIREMLSSSIWLELPHKIRWGRRVHFKYQEYETNVLIPMHEQFAQPTKKYAEHVINVESLPKEAVFEKVDKVVSNFLDNK